MHKPFVFNIFAKKFQKPYKMKKNYILSFALFSLFSLNITAQENSSYNDDNAIQKTISFSDSSLTKEEAINDFFKS